MIAFTEKNNKRKPLNKLLPSVKMPLGICIEPTNICNFKCVQCPMNFEDFYDIVGSRGHMDIKLYEKLLLDIKAMGKLNNLNLYGDGEPLLNKNLTKMIRMARDHDVSEVVTITTNASLLSEKLSFELINSGLTYLRVSIYSIYKENNYEITKSKISPKLIYGKLKRFKQIRDQIGKEKPILYVKIIDTYGNENDAFIRKYAKVCDEVNIERPMNWNGFDNRNLIAEIDKKGKTDETLIQGYYGSKSLSGYKKICTTPFLSLNVKQNGDVCICIVDWNKGTTVGNIKDENLKEIWFGENLRKFRRMHIEGRRYQNESCRNCKFLYSNPDNMDNHSKEWYESILAQKCD